MAKNIKNEIIEHLKRKGNYDINVDEYVIDILIENLEYARELKEIIKEEGLIITMLNGNGFSTTKENPAYGTYVKCLDNIHQCANKLGINRNDRLKLKLIEEKDKDDEFNKLMST